MVDDFATIADRDARDSALSWLSGDTNSGEFWSEFTQALREVCVDDLGQQAVGAAIQHIVVHSRRGEPASLTLSGGTLTYNYNFADSPGAYRLFASDIRSTLEQAL